MVEKKTGSDNNINRISVSITTYNEIANALAALGRKMVVSGAPITLEPDDALIDPLDWRQIAVRKDIVQFAAAYQPSIYSTDENGNSVTKPNPQSFVHFLAEVYLFVLKGEVPQTEKIKMEKATTDGW